MSGTNEARSSVRVGDAGRVWLVRQLASSSTEIHASLRAGPSEDARPTAAVADAAGDRRLRCRRTDSYRRSSNSFTAALVRTRFLEISVRMVGKLVGGEGDVLDLSIMASENYYFTTFKISRAPAIFLGSAVNSH